MMKYLTEWTLSALVSALVLLGMPIDARSDVELAQTTRSASDIFPILRDVPGLSNLPASNSKKSGALQSATVTLRGKPATIYGFKIGNTDVAAIVPSSFALNDIVPIPQNAPTLGVQFKDVAFIYVPKGGANPKVSTNSFPSAVKIAANHLGQSVPLQEGLNLFGLSNFNGANSIRTVLQTIGHSQPILPVTGVFPPNLFENDPKNAPKKIKDALLTSLKLDLPLPKLKIPGMPDIVVVDNARLAIVGRNVKGKPQVFVGVTGGLDVKLASAVHRFSFGLLAADPGKAFKPTITAESKDTVKLPFVQPLDLTAMQLVAEKKGNTWDLAINASAKLKGKTIAVSVHHDPKNGDTAAINTKMTLADLLPTGTNLPGVTDVEFDKIAVSKNVIQVFGQIKGMDAGIAAFKHNGRTLIAVATPKPVHISNLVPQLGKTPLDDVSFNNMVYLWVPKGANVTGLKPSDLPPSIAEIAVKAGVPITTKDGINIVGQMGIAKNGELGQLLTMAGLYKSSLPLAGALSPAIFQKGNATQIKNEILDHLNFNISLPKINLPGLSSVVGVQNTTLAIKGENVNGTRSLDVAVGGELDFSVTGTKLQLDYVVALHKQSGQPDSLALSAKQPKDKIITIKLLESFKISDLNFQLTKKNGKYAALLLGKSTFRGKPVSVGYGNVPKPGLWVSASNLTLKDLMGTSTGVSEIDNIEFSGFGMMPDRVNLSVQIRGQKFWGIVSKVPGQSKPFFIARSAEQKLSPASFIPGAENTQLKDADFEQLSFLYNPTNKTGPVSTFPESIRSFFSNNLVVKPGLNIYGDLVVHPSGEMATLLKMAGITEVKLPLSGAFSPKVFSKNMASVKNEILDNLDISVPLPKLNIPGVSTVADIQSATLAIKGKNVNGARSVDVAIVGELDFSVAGTKLPLNYEAVLHKQAGQPNSLALSAKQPKDKTVTIKLLETFKVSDLDFELTKKNGKYDALLLGKSTFRGKPVSVGYSNAPKPKLWVSAQNLMLKDLVGSSIGVPEIDNIEFAGFAVLSDQFNMGVKVQGHLFYGTVAKAPGQSKPFFILRSGEPKVSIADLIPGAEKTPLKDTDFQQVAFLYNPTTKTGPVSTFPKFIQPYFPGNLIINPGFNISGDLVAHPSGEMAALLKDVGVTSLKLPLNGGFSPKVLLKNVSAAQIEKAILDGLDIQLNIPTPHIAAMEQFLTFKNGHLGIKGKLPDGKRGIAFQVSGDTELKVANEDIAFFVEVDADRSQGGQETDFEVKGHTDKPWVHPMGISFLTMEELGLDIRKQTTGATKTYDVSLSAKTDIGSHSKLDVEIDVHEEGGSLTDVFFKLNGPFKLSDIPGLNQIPHADKFALTKLIISEHGIEADTILGGKATDLFAFNNSGWNVALTQKDFAITELLPPLKNTPLKEIKFPFLALMLSEEGLDKQFSQLSKVGQDALKDIFTSPSDTVKIDKGLAIIAGFHPDNAGTLKDGVKGIGVHDSVVVIGEIDGIFGGSPKVKLEGKLSKTGKPHHMPNGTSYKTGEEVAFFINVLESGQDFDFELGIEVGVNTKIKNDILLFDSRVKMEIMDEGFGIDVEGQMKGTWHKPFGINGLSLSDVTIELGTQEDGAIKLGFGGATVIADQHFKMAADGKFLPEALGFPQAIAFVGSADTLPLLFVEDIALKVLAKEIKFDLPQGIMPVFKNAKFAFATPGAEDPDLKIDGEGFALKGGLSWLGHELGSVNMSVSPTKGIYVADKIDDIDLGPLKLTDNHFTMKAGLKNIVPTVSVNADIEIKYLGIKDKFDVNFDKKGASFETTTKFGDDFSMHNLLRLSGIDLSLTKPSFTNADFYMEGDMQLDIGKFVEEPSKAALDAVFNELSAGFKLAEKDVKAARAKVDGLTDQINAERAKVRKERAAAEKVLQGAEDRVNSLNKEIDNDWGHYHGCSGWFSWACEARWGIEIGFLKGARDIADAALELAKTTVDHFPLDLDPRIAALIVTRDGASAILTAALDAFEGADFFDKVLKEVSDTVTSLVGKSVNIHKAAFEGDLKGLIDGSQPLAVTLDAEVFGAQIEQIIPFNPTNIAYDVKQMSFLGLRALEHIVEEVIKDLPVSIKHKIVNNITSQVGIQKDAAKKELAKYGKAFAGYEKEEAALQKVIAARDKAFMQQKYAAAHNPLDLGKSAIFANDFIEVGHTGLCLDNVSGLIKQDRCKEGTSSRWSTTPIDGAPNVPANSGYVYITDAKTGECIVPEGKWAEEKKQFTDPGLPAGKAFSYSVNTFEGDGKITVAACANKREYYWKILKHGEGWMQMANRATNKCLHFKDSSSLPGQATAQWASCTGSANQVFRVADKTTPEYYASKIALKNDSQSACFSDPGADGKITMVDCTKGALYDYVIDVRGYIKFINTKTGGCMQPKTYKNGAHLIEKSCTQLDFQWWNPIEVPGGWRIQNAQTNTCTRAPGLGQVAVTETCKDWAQSVIAPVIDPYSGTTYTSAPSGALGADIPGTGDDGSGICSVQISSVGNTQITGTANGNKCTYNYAGKIQTKPTGGKTLLVNGLDGTLWQAHRAIDKMPEYAIPSGSIDDGTKSKTTYICRVQKGRNIFDGHGAFTRFGWAAEQDPKGDNCHAPNGDASVYEVLVRRADKAYLLNLSDWKPGGSKAGKDPVVKALASQKGLYRNEKIAAPVSQDPKIMNGKPLKGWAGQITVSTVGDIVTLKGSINVGQGEGRAGPVWKLPANLGPKEIVVLSLPNNNQDNGGTERSNLHIHPDGTITVSAGGYVDRDDGGAEIYSIDFPSVSYGTRWANLPLKEPLAKKYRDTFASPGVVKVGKFVVVTGLVSGFTKGGQAITHLPYGSRPSKKLSFGIAGETATGDGSGDYPEQALIPIDVYPDGRIMVGGDAYSPYGLVNLSGISFQAGATITTQSDSYGQLLNSWKPDLARTGGYSYTVSDDIVTLKGGITGGSGIDKIWQLPPEARPPELLLFNVSNNSEGVPLRIEIHPSGLITGSATSNNIGWIDFSGVKYNRKKGTPIRLSQGWQAMSGFAPPTMTKIGKEIILGGVVSTTNQGGSNNLFGRRPEQKFRILALPYGSAPRENLKFELLQKIDGHEPVTINVNVYGNGYVRLDLSVSGIESVSLSGISFTTQ